MRTVQMKGTYRRKVASAGAILLVALLEGVGLLPAPVTQVQLAELEPRVERLFGSVFLP